MKRHLLLILVISLGGFVATSQAQQSRESAAVDPTATQWSYQFAVEAFFDYKTDTMKTGAVRPKGNNGFFQFRWVAPIPKGTLLPITLLPRLTFRLISNAEDDIGIGGSDLFVLGILGDWGTGRWGIGPQINFPAMDGFGNKKFGFGLAAAITQRAMSDKLFFSLLLQQTWTSVDDGMGGSKSQASPLSINPAFVLQLGQGWYIGNGDFLIRYMWDGDYKGWWFPFGVRVGRAFVLPDKTYNAYIEYANSLIYEDWIGAIPTWSIRVNFQFQIPVSL
jgi:hypothetical protein